MGQYAYASTQLLESKGLSEADRVPVKVLCALPLLLPLPLLPSP